MHDSDVLTQLDFKIKSGKHRIKIPAKVIKSANSYPYSGKKITIECVAELKVDDSLILKDSTVTRNIAKCLPTGIRSRTAVNNNAKELIEPKDAFKFSKNLMALPSETARGLFFRHRGESFCSPLPHPRELGGCKFRTITSSNYQRLPWNESP